MAEIKVSEMVEAESVNDEDLIMIVQNGVNKKVLASKVGTGKGGVTGDTLPIGAVIEWNSDIIPANWLLCNGQEVSRTDYAELFEILGTTYGEGDGSTTFNLPNRKGNVAVGKNEDDEDLDTLGKTGGEKDHTLTIDEMPSHDHQKADEWGTASNSYGYTNVWHYSAEILKTDVNIRTGKTGGGEAHNNLQPYTVANFIIKAKQSAGLVATVVNSLQSDSEVDGLSAKQGKVLNEKITNATTYSTEEINTEEKWVDGKDIYRKVIYIGILPDDAKEKYAHNILNMDYLVQLNVTWYDTVDGKFWSLNRYDNAEAYIKFSCDKTNVQCETVYTWSDRTKDCYVILEYTKTTD